MVGSYLNRQCLEAPALRGRRANQVASVLAAAVLMLQALAPPGYMPGSLAEGWPVVLCPDGLPAHFLPGHSGHAGHGLDADGGAVAHCPLGSVLDASSVDFPLFLTDADWLPAALRFDYATPRVQQRPRGPATARGPPLLAEA